VRGWFGPRRCFSRGLEKVGLNAVNRVNTAVTRWSFCAILTNQSTRLILLPEVIYGAEAVSQNRRSRAGRALYEDFRKAWRRILRDVVTKLLDARLVAYGSFDSSLNTEELYTRRCMETPESA